jgi:hypothetical protein
MLGEYFLSETQLMRAPICLDEMSKTTNRRPWHDLDVTTPAKLRYPLYFRRLIITFRDVQLYSGHFDTICAVSQCVN